MNFLQKVFTLNTKCVSIIRQVQTNANLLENCKEIINNNPRNLELMRIAKKPRGYNLDHPRYIVSCWQKVLLKQSRRYLKAELHHYQNGPVITVSTLDWCMKKYLYRLNHVSAFINVGRVFGQRCLESGISYIHCNIELSGSSKSRAFYKGLLESGLMLKEPTEYRYPNPSDKKLMPKPWAI